MVNGPGWGWWVVGVLGAVGMGGAESGVVGGVGVV
jgi:hypothetical protein